MKSNLRKLVWFIVAMMLLQTVISRDVNGFVQILGIVAAYLFLTDNNAPE